jgi:hypothetical protein
MDHLHRRLEALEQQTAHLQQQTQALKAHTHTVERQLRWWRGLACGLLVLAVLTWALPAGMAREEASKGGEKGLEQRVAALEDLLTHVSRKSNEVLITGANLHIVNGLGSTDCTDAEGNPIPGCPNGLGNVIVGYNEPRDSVFGENIRTGSHNVVVGPGHNFSRFGGVVAGELNEISGEFASVLGGDFNTANNRQSAVIGGSGNTASGLQSVVCGGENNKASGTFAVVCRGRE